MNSGKNVFRQLLGIVNQHEPDKCVKRYCGGHRVGDFKCRHQFVQLLFGQITPLEPLRSIFVCLKAHKCQLYHSGAKQYVSRTTFSRANGKRGWRILAGFGGYPIGLVRPLYAGFPVPKEGIGNESFALDSTAIPSNINLFTWAGGKYPRGAVKIHSLLNLRGNIPEFTLATDGKNHGGNVLDAIVPHPEAICLMGKAYAGFAALYRMQMAVACFVARFVKRLSDGSK